MCKHHPCSECPYRSTSPSDYIKVSTKDPKFDKNLCIKIVQQRIQAYKEWRKTID